MVYMMKIVAKNSNDWTAKYAPRSINDVVFPNVTVEREVRRYVSESRLPHLLLVGPPGTGKSTLAHMLPNWLGVSEMAVHTLVGGSRNKVSDVRAIETKLQLSLSLFNEGKFEKQVVIWDEVDLLSLDALLALKGLIDAHGHRVTFVFTSNHFQTLLGQDPALVDRLNRLDFAKPPRQRIAERAKQILRAECKNLSNGRLDELIEYSYPSMRKLISNLQAA